MTKNQAFSKIWIIGILVVLVGGGILAYQFWWAPKEEIKVPEVKAPEEAAPEEAAPEEAAPEEEEVEEKETELPQEKETVPKILSPEEVVTNFSKAVQNRDKALARTFLSSNANREAFKSTLEEESTSLLYENEFTFSITQSKLSENKQEAEIDVDIKIGDETIKTKASLVLEEKVVGEKVWLLTNFFAFYGEKLNRTLFLLYGPADLSMSSPSGESLGYGTDNNTIDLDGVFASYLSGLDFKQITITDLYGIWKLKITGIDSGTFILTTEIVDPENHQIGTVEDEITSGQTREYEVYYPLLKGVPIIVSPIVEE